MRGVYDMRREYLLQRDSLLVDHTIDCRPESVKGHDLPVIEVSGNLNTLELIFDALKSHEK